MSKNNNNSDENKAKKYQQRSSYTLKQPEDKRLTEKYQIYEVAKNNNNYNYNNRYENSNLYPRKSNDSNTSNYLIKSRDSKQNIKDENQGRRHYTNKSYQGEKFPPKYYRNNPLLRTENINEENNASNNKKSYLLKNNKNNIFIGNMETVAQKICNIVIKGSNPNKEKESNSNLSNRSYINKKINNNYNYNKEEEIEYDDSFQRNQNTNYEYERNIQTKEKSLNKKNKKKIKKKNVQIIQMQKAQSFEQPRDYISMPKQKYKPKFDIGKARNYMPEIDKNLKKEMTKRENIIKKYRQNILRQKYKFREPIPYHIVQERKKHVVIYKPESTATNLLFY